MFVLISISYILLLPMRFSSLPRSSRAASVCDASKTDLEDQTLAPGKHVKLQVRMPPSMDDALAARLTLCEVTHCDRERRRVCWGSHELPKWALYSDRWQSVVAADAEGRTSKYETREVNIRRAL
jgi:hypothetical protein